METLDLDGTTAANPSFASKACLLKGSGFCTGAACPITQTLSGRACLLKGRGFCPGAARQVIGQPREQGSEMCNTEWDGGSQC